MEKNKLFLGLVLFFLLSFVHLNLEFGWVEMNNYADNNYDKYPKTSDSDYFDWITPSSENITISDYYNFTIRVNNTSGSWNFQVKIWRGDPSIFYWDNLQYQSDQIWNYTFDPINYENGNWNITVKCQYNAFEWDNDTKNIYILNERPKINVSNPNDSEIISDFYNYRINASVSDKEDNGFNVSIALLDSEENLEFGWVEMNNYADNNYDYYFDPINYENGEYMVSIRANDSKGYGYENISILIQNNRPNITIHYPFESQTIEEVCMLNVSVSDGEGDIINVSVGLYNVSNDLVLGWEEMENYKGELYNYSLNPNGLKNELYYLRIRANDSKGFAYESIEITINVQSDSPTDEKDGEDNNTDDDNDKGGIWDGLLTPAIISGIISGLVAISIKIGYSFLKKKKEKLKNIKNIKFKAPKLKKEKETISYNEFWGKEGGEKSGSTKMTKEEMEQMEDEMNIEGTEFNCLVHKGKIDKNIYVCPNCQSTYCQRCARALKGKEEECWNCGAPIEIEDKIETKDEEMIRPEIRANNEWEWE